MSRVKQTLGQKRTAVMSLRDDLIVVVFILTSALNNKLEKLNLVIFVPNEV